MAHYKRLDYPWWLLTLAAFGLVALCAVILTLFFPFGRRPAEIRLTGSPEVGSAEFLAAVAGTAGSPLRTGGTAHLLNNGVEFFPALLADLRAARQTIHFFVYIWEPGAASDQVFAALIERARAGVKVRLLLDGLGGIRAPEKDIEALEAAGGTVQTFRAPRFGQLTRFHKRNHRRTIVIDGRVAYTGGMAVGDKWLGDASSEEEWRDIMVRLTGPLAVTVQSAFVAPWAHSSGELLAAADGVFPPEVVGGGAVPVTSATSPSPSPPPSPPSPPASGDGASAPESVTLHTGLASAPSSEDHPLRLLFIQTFAGARKRLWITTPYFVPDQATREAVAERARAGVDVRVLLPDEHTDAKPIRLTSHHYFEELLEAGVRIYEYQPTMLHSKSVVVDGLWSVVGSANMDIRSKELNSENVLGILDAGFAREMEETFLADMAKAHEFQLEAWRRRGRWARVKERVAVLFAEQY